MINRVNIILAFFLFFFVSMAWAGQINSVSSEENSLLIQLTSKPNYKIIPQDDPFRLKIELIDTKPGIISQKMLFHSGLVSEIFAQAYENNTILDILFSQPTKAEIITEGNVLRVSFGKNSLSQEEPVKIIDINMEKTESGYEISIKGDNVLPEPEVIKEGNTIKISFSDVDLATEPSKDIPLILDKKDNILEFNFKFDKEVQAEASYLVDEVVLHINIPKEKEEVILTSKDMIPSTKIAKNNSKKLEQTELIEKKILSPEKNISLDLQDADIVGALRFLAEAGGYNLVIHPRIGGKITMVLKNVTITQAMDLICKNNNLVKLEENNVIRILPIDSYLIEIALSPKEVRLYKLKYVRPSIILQRTANFTTIFTETRIFQYFNIDSIRVKKDDKTGEIVYEIDSIKEKEYSETIKYLRAGETVEEKVIKLLGFSTDELTGTLIVNAPSLLHKEIEKVIAKLDVPQKQILIEARIIEISSSFSKSLGFQWGIRWSPPGSRTNIVGSQGGTISGGSTPLAVNLPAGTGRAGGTSAITVGYLNASGTFALDLRISALQQTGKGKIISNPRIVTLDNQKATIIQGESIPYGERTITGGTTEISTKFKDVAITLDVTPRVIDENMMNLYVSFTKEDLVQFVNIGGILAPLTVKLSSNTEATVKPGETLVLGGIYKKVDRMSNSKVPGLGDIPLVGELFTSRGRDEDIYEVMIFITPRIIEPQPY